MLDNHSLGYYDGLHGFPPERIESIAYMSGYLQGEEERGEED